MGALFGMGTAVGSAAFRHFTGPGTEGPLLQWFQDFVLDSAVTMGREAIYSVDRKDIDFIQKGKNNTQK